MEVCSSIKAIKYIHKYTFKGNDRMTIQLQNENDEVACHLSGRYIGPTQAAWSLLEYRSHLEDPTVIRLTVHLPNEIPIYFNENIQGDPIQLRNVLENADSTLTTFFRYNSNNPDGRHLLYQDFPKHYRYWAKKGERRWTPRKRHFNVIGRMYHCNPFAGERYYLRLLLTSVTGPRSFEDLRIVDNHLYPTFRAACVALGLLEDDGEWVSCFT